MATRGLNTVGGPENSAIEQDIGWLLSRYENRHATKRKREKARKDQQNKRADTEEKRLNESLFEKT
jgi:hypothetical protein